MPAEKLGVSPYSAAARRPHTCALPADRNNPVDFGQRALAFSSLGLSGHYCHEPVKVKLGGPSTRGVRPARSTRHPGVAFNFGYVSTDEANRLRTRRRISVDLPVIRLVARSPSVCCDERENMDRCVR